MPIMAIYRRDGISAELYNKYRASVPIDEVPRGALAHAYGRTGTGFVAIDIWEDPRAMDRFIRGSVIPASEALGVAFEWPEVIELSTFITTPAGQHYEVPFLQPAAEIAPMLVDAPRRGMERNAEQRHPLSA